MNAIFIRSGTVINFFGRHAAPDFTGGNIFVHNAADGDVDAVRADPDILATDERRGRATLVANRDCPRAKHVLAGKQITIGANDAVLADPHRHRHRAQWRPRKQ
jgi:hypothetical protein